MTTPEKQPSRTAPDGLIDSRDLLFYVIVNDEGHADCGGTTKDWVWVAASLRHLADVFEKRVPPGRVPPEEGGDTRLLPPEPLGHGGSW